MYATHYTGDFNLYFGEVTNVSESGLVMPDLDMWNDLKLYPTNEPDIELPEVETKTVDIPGSFGNIDLTTFLTGYPIYKNRKGNLEFRLLERENKENILLYLTNKLHGRTLNLFEDVVVDGEHKPSQWFYTGYFTLKFTTEDQFTRITIDYELEPFKKFVQTKTLSFTDQTKIEIPLNIGQYPIVVTPFLDISDTSSNNSKLWCWNKELNINYTALLHAGYNYLGNLMMISNMSGKNTGDNMFIRMTGEGETIIKYNDTSL